MVDRLAVSAEHAAELLGVDLDVFHVLIDSGLVPIKSDVAGYAVFSILDLLESREWMESRWRDRSGQERMS